MHSTAHVVSADWRIEFILGFGLETQGGQMRRWTNVKAQDLVYLCSRVDFDHPRSKKERKGGQEDREDIRKARLRQIESG